MGCVDDTSPTLTVTPPGVDLLLGTVECTVDRHTASVVCTEPQRRREQDGPSLALLSSSAIKMKSANFVADSVTGVWSFDATAQNLLTYVIGTPDGQTKTGLKVFFETGPTARYANVGDTGTVTVRNPDGRQNFTAAQQPYHFYDTILSPQAITNPKRWEFTVPRTVTGFSFAVRIFTSTPRESRVPESAPSLKPAWFYDPAYSVDCGTLLTGTCLRNVVLVEFRGDATQEERQSAVDAIRGRVVGGQTGAYFVQVPTPDTSYIQHLSSALAQLDKLPQVEYASGYLTTRPSPDFAQPHDTTGWRQWQLNPDSADGDNWAFERVGAPFAWGCSVGDTSTVIGIVDNGFHTISDLTKNSSLMEAPDAYPDAQDHGASVAAIAAGFGNDSLGVSGMMWRGKVRMYDWTHNGSGDFQDLWDNIRDARVDGARVVNVSVGYNWGGMDPDTVTNVAKQQANAATVRNLYRGFRRAMDTLAAASQPLVVFSAGNARIDARWNAARVATDSAAPNGWAVLVVGGSNRADGPYTRTNTGTVVKIAAPAEDVYVIGGNGAISSGEGTSYAAPMVAGAAGLLFAFDPRLTAQQARELLVQGAERGGRRVGGSGPPILNVHESLILAGRRAGAPLCGNRLWMKGGTLYAQRDTASAAGEALFSVPTSSPTSRYSFNALHGGKLVNAWGGGAEVMRQWTPTGWTAAPLPAENYPLGSNASLFSRFRWSHDGDTLLTIISTRTAPTVTFTLRLDDNRTGTRRTLGDLPVAPYTDGTAVCIRELFRVTPDTHEYLTTTENDSLRQAYTQFQQRIAAHPCQTTSGGNSSRHATARGVYSPRGDRAYVFVTERAGSTTPGAWVDCITWERLWYGNNYLEVPVEGRCRSSQTVSQSAGTKIYEVNILSGAISVIGWGDPQAELLNPGLREHGKEWVIDRQLRTLGSRTFWEPDVNYPIRRDSAPVLTCTSEYRTVATGGVLLAPTGAACQFDGGEGGFSANRSPAG
jgi:hypothetical protein